MMTDEGYVPLDGGFDIFPIVLERYTESDELTGAETEADKIAGLLGRYGGVVHPWSVRPERRDLLAAKSRLDEWANAATRSSVLLWLGHGKMTGGGARLLVPRSATADELIPPDALADKLLELLKRRAENRWVAVVIEACSASAFVDHMWRALNQRLRPGVLLIGSGTAGGNGYLGNFRRALTGISDGHEQAGYTSHDLDISLADFAARFSEQLSRSDSVQCGQVRGFDPFFRRRRSIATLTVPVDLFGRLRRELEQLPPAEQALLRVPVSLGEFGGRLAGRAAEAERITEFLRRAVGGTLVVTGQPGCGKSALLSSVLLAAHQDMRRGLTELGLATSGPGGRIEIGGSLLLTGASLHDVIADVASIAGVTLPTGTPTASDSATELLAALRHREHPLTLVVDSLDEAADPFATAALLRELDEVGQVSLVVGTRRCPAADTGRAADDLVVVLGVPDGQVVELGHDADAMASFVSDRLRHDPRFQQARGPNVRTDAALIAEAVTDATARRSPGDFLLARLLIEEFLTDPGMEIGGEGFGRLLELDHDQAFAAALTRITDGCSPVGPCLRALALSCGRGVPRAGSVWETMARALAGDQGIGEADLDEVLKRAGAFIMLDYVDGQSVYRLAHRVFRDHLTADADGQNEAVARALLRLAARQDDLSPYLRRYLPAHLARLGEPGWALLEAAPDVLDRLDLPSLVTAAQSALGGLSQLPPNLAGVVVTSHLAAASTPADRPGLRQLGATRVSGRWPQQKSLGAAWTLTGAQLRPQRIHLTLPGHRGPVYGLAMIEGPADRRLLASGGEDGTVRLWDPDSGWRMRSDVAGQVGPVLGLAALTLDRDVPVLASVGVRDPLRTFEAMTGRQLDTLPDTEAGQHCAVISFRVRDGSARLAVADTQGGIRVLSAAPLRMRGERMTGHVGEVANLVAVPMPGGRILIATGGHDRTVRLWDPQRCQQVLPTMEGPSSPVTSICVLSAADGPQLVTGHENGEICCWDPVRKLPLPGTVPTASARLIVAALPSAGRLVAAAGSDGVVRVWDLDAGQPVGPDGIGHERPVVRILNLPRIGRFATAGDDGTIRIWEADGLPAPRAGPRGRRARPPNRRVWRSAAGEPEWTVTAGDDGTLTYTAPTQPTWTFPGMGALTRAAFVVTTPAGRLLAVAENSAVRLWDLGGGGLYGVLQDHDGICAMTQAQSSGGPPMLVVGAEDGTLRVWETSDCRLRHVVRLGSRVHGLRANNRTVQVSLDEGEIAIELHPDAFCVGDARSNPRG
jgi:WD40 repeat protein